MDVDDDFEFEGVLSTTGRRSGHLITVAVHSTRLGPALGGCRLWTYPSWRDAQADAMRLARGMTFKNALAGLDAGGGKTVVRIGGTRPEGELRRDIFLDVGDAVETFGGAYVTGEDVGTTSADMAVVTERTRHAVGLPPELGGSGDPGPFTARGVHAAITATLEWLDGSPDVAGRRFSIAGLGQVGSSLLRRLAAEGAVVTATDVDSGKRALAESLGATWCEPGEAHRVECDVFVPAGVGGMLSTAVIGELRSRAVVGPANNQLAEPDGAERLRDRGILYAPDYLVNAGGVIHLQLAAEGQSREATLERIDAIGDTLTRLLRQSEELGITTVAAADLEVQRRLTPAPASVVE